MEDLELYFTIAFMMSACVFMIGMSAQLQVTAVRDFFRDRDTGKIRLFRPIIVGLTAQLLLNPIIGGVIIACFPSLDRRMRIMAVIIMCSASGLGSNLMTVISQGNLEASVLMTATSTMLSGITFPPFTLLSIRVIWSLDDDGTELPLMNFVGSVLVLTIPIVIGLLLQRYCSVRLVKAVSTIGLVCGFFIVVIGVLTYFVDEDSGRALEQLSNPSVFLLTFILNAVGIVMGYVVGLLSRVPEEHRRTLAFEVGAQNLSMPLGVCAMAIPANEQYIYMAMLAAYGITQATITLPTALFFRWCFPLTKEQQPEAAATDVGEEEDLGPPCRNDVDALEAEAPSDFPPTKTEIESPPLEKQSIIFADASSEENQAVAKGEGNLP